MVKQTRTNVTREIDKLSEHDTQAVLGYISQLLSSRKSPQKETSINDDFIASLSDAYENKRARQVTEWERVAGRQFYRAA